MRPNIVTLLPLIACSQLLIWYLPLASASNNTLRLLIIIHRHGDRTPIQSYPKDPYRNDSYWPDGWGQLTEHGKARMYNLGVAYRQRYKDFLTDNPREVSVSSSGADRCLESAALLLAGLYPPTGRWVWDQALQWQPFPIQTMPRRVDGMLNPSSYCPNADKELQRIHSTEEYQNYNQQFLDLYRYLTLNTGENITDVNTAERLNDVLLIEKQANYALHPWVNNEVMEKLTDISAHSFYFDFSTKLIQRLRAGLVLREIRNRLKKATKDSLRKKLYLFSSHDTLVAAVLSALGVFDIISPPYGASIIFELHSFNETDHKIAVYYHNETITGQSHLLKLPACGYQESCHLGQFLHNTEDLIVENWKLACGLIEEGKTASSELIVFVLLVSFVITLSLVAIVIMFMYIRRRGKPYVYRLLPVS